MKRPRILVAEDHTLVAEAFQRLLEPLYEVVGIVVDGRALLDSAAQLKPDVAIIDIGMPLLNGLDAGRQLKRTMSRIKIIFVTMNEDTDIAAEALRFGASAYLFKTSASAELLKAVQETLRGRSYVTPRIAERMQATFIRDPRPDRPAKHLTMRQREVLQLLAEGRPMKEVASILRVTPRTIAFHKYRTMEEFGLKNNAELVRFAIRQGMLKAS
jgi:DNA-binding NarL/FixJ family response regulator